MNKYFYALILFLCSQLAVAAGNATPFGVEVGAATVSDVQKQIGSQTKLRQTGTNQYSGGKMFDTDGKGLEVDGVNKVTFIFDANEILAGVLVSMPKDPKSLAKTFTGKYQTVSNRIDNFMNYGYAKFKKGDTIIEIDAPHLGFEMEVRYVTQKLMAAFLQQSANEEAAKQKRKANSL